MLHVSQITTIPTIGATQPHQPSDQTNEASRCGAQRVSCGQFDATAVFDASACKKFGNKKPPYSYANLITFAINASPKGRVTLAEIYEWISGHFPFYNPSSNGWKVSLNFNFLL